jgi:hypothetical protein
VYGGTTQISQWILNAIDPTYDIESKCEGEVIKVYLTATYKKPVDIFKIKENQLFTWGLDDIEMCKYIGNDEARDELLNSCKKKYGVVDGKKIFEDSLADLREAFSLDTDQEVYANIENEYKKFPTLHVITSLFDMDVLEKTLSKNVNGYGFDFNNIFATTKTEEKQKRFVNEASVINLLEYIADFSKETSILRRIRRTFIQYDQDKRTFFSQLWFLPYFIGNRIADVSSTLKDLIEKSSASKWYSNYSIYIANDKSDKQSVKMEELKARRQGKKGLIIFVGKKFSLGVSLPCVDVVMFLNNDHNVDDLYQRMFRALTESRGKKLGILVDMNPYRSITTLIEYTTPPRKLGQVLKKEDILESVRDASTRKTWLLDTDLMRVSNEHQKSYNEIYNKIKEVIDMNFLTEQLEKTKKESQEFFKEMLDTNDEILENFINVKDGNDKGNKQKLLELGKQPIKPINGDGKDKGNKKPTKQKEKSKEKEIEEKKKLLAEVFGDLCVLYALLLPEECLNMSFRRLCNELTKVAKCDSNRNSSNNSTSNSSNSKLDKYGLHELWNITMDKLGTVISVHESSNSKSTFNKRQLLCTKVRDLLKNYFAFENILSFQINTPFVEMKRHVVDIDEKDMNKIHSFVEKYLTPKEYEKKAFGEVFTPLSLVREMLEAIPKYADSDFWKNPKLKILDPAAGIGNFPLIAYELLMEGLKHAIPDVKKRKRHILENMLHMVELNANNVRLMKKIFGSKSYKLNIIQGDFLSDDTHNKMKKEWKVEKYDLVMGNPPFQKSVSGTRQGGYGGTSLWDKFVEEVLEKRKLLNDKGLLSFIHPPSWRKPEDSIREMFTQYDILYLNIKSEKEGRQYFNAGTKFDWYILRNTKTSKLKTDISDESNRAYKLVLDDWTFIPNGKYRLFAKLFDFKQKNTFEVIYSSSAYETRKSWISLKHNNKNDHPVVHTLNKEGIGFVWSDTKDKGHYGIPKVLMTFGRHQYPYNDYKGEYGMSQIIYGLKIKNKKEGDEVVEAIDSKTFKEVLKYSKWNVFNTEWRMFKYLRRDFHEVLLEESKSPNSKKSSESKSKSR